MVLQRQGGENRIVKSGVLDNLLHFKGPYKFLKISSTLENKKMQEG